MSDKKLHLLVQLFSYSSRTNLNVKPATAVMANRKAKSSLNSAIKLIMANPLTIFPVARTDGISTGIQTGKSRKDKSKVFPSENITRPETKEPAIDRSIIPSKEDKQKFHKFFRDFQV